MLSENESKDAPSLCIFKKQEIKTFF